MVKDIEKSEEHFENVFIEDFFSNKLYKSFLMQNICRKDMCLT